MKKRIGLGWTVFIIITITIAYVYHTETGDIFCGFMVYFSAILSCFGMWVIDTRNFYYVEYLKAKE